MHDYTHAIMGISDPLPEENPTEVYKGLLIDSVRNEVQGYKRVLEELNINVVELHTKGHIREKVMMEELAVVHHGIAMIPKPRSRTEERSLNLSLLHQTFLKFGLTVVDQDPESTAKLYPPDVLFTGREFFVGISQDTDEHGASWLAETFPEYPCMPIKMPQGSLPLKKYITVAGVDILSCCDTELGRELLRRLEREATFCYQTFTVPTLAAANCVFAKNTLLHKGIEDLGDSVFKVFCDKIDYPRRSLMFTELSKINLDPSSCVLLMIIP